MSIKQFLRKIRPSNTFGLLSTRIRDFNGNKSGNSETDDWATAELKKPLILNIMDNLKTNKQLMMRKSFSYFLVLLIFTFFIQACSSSKMPIVGKNKSLNADFESIKTYAWTSDIDKIPTDIVFIGLNGVYIFNNKSGRKMIKDAIQYELSAKGYKMVETNPDMLLSFKVLEQPASLRTTNGYATLWTGEKIRTADNVSYTDVKPGTLIIDIVKADQNKQIWQGFVSGILRPDMMNDQSHIRNAVSMVFKQFIYNNVN